MPHKALFWAKSTMSGRISEIAVLAPVKKGCAPGESRTYEQRLRYFIEDIARRHREGLPVELTRVPSIHFGRMLLIRPEQYLLHSALDEVDYYPRSPEADRRLPDPRVPERISEFTIEPQPPAGPRTGATAPPAPAPASGDEGALPWCEPSHPTAGSLRTWLLTLVEFDGDLRVYMRDIAEDLGVNFDRVFENCEHYPGTRDFEAFWAWIRRYQIETTLFYAPYGELTTTRIRQLQDFKNRFDAFVAEVRSPERPRDRPIEDLFDQFLHETGQYVRDFPSQSGIFAPFALREPS